MQSDKFDKFVRAVSLEFGISEDKIFKRTKQRLNVDARQALFYLCHKHNISTTYVQEYLKSRGLEMNHSTIIHGRKHISERMKWDEYLKEFLMSL